MSGISCENGNEGMAENFFDTRPRIRYWRRVISAVIWMLTDLIYPVMELHSVSKSTGLRGDLPKSYLI